MAAIDTSHLQAVVCDEAINTPAVAAAVVVKSYTSQANDQISFEVGDMISVIDMPSSEESVWWRGKRGFQVGLFPSECVEIIGNQIPHLLRFFHIKHDSTFLTIRNHRNCSQSTKPVLRKQGKFLAFCRSYLLLRSHQASKNHCRQNIFGCDLSEHLLNVDNDIPFILKCCAEIIEERGIVDGIYRLSGVTSNIQKLRKSFHDSNGPDFSDKSIIQDIHCVASLLKMYFRELPNPLLTYELYDDFVKAIEPVTNIQCNEMRTEDDKLEKLKEVLRRLPAAHYTTLKYLMKHLSKVSSYGSRTGMTPKNVAIVWAPNLLRCKEIEARGGVTALHMIGVQAVLTEYLIRYEHFLFVDDEWTLSSMRCKSLPQSAPALLSLEEARSRRRLLVNSEQEVSRVDHDDHAQHSCSKYTFAEVFNS
ncbi:uncharacterized protein B4U80_07178 [Leptotrombidium deliense]|uniref:Uncharacterized protein n=1 Tax=Leptotrombidium deliense TaxID=299467 RepID=A0A443SDA1_9ACAR|nr:uncharacterized protein B4U80_07178 [Leptotrombidium deliense]